jgi:hypothetical protein
MHSFVQQRPLYSLYAAENDRFIAAPQYPAKQLQKDMLGPVAWVENSSRSKPRMFHPVPCS